MTNQQIVDRLTQNTSQPAHSEAQDEPYVASVGSSAEKTCDRVQVAGRARLPGNCLSTPSDNALFDPMPEAMDRPVRLAGRMISNGYEQENWEWLTRLTYTDSDGRHVGRDPMSIPPQVLRAAGHGPRRTKSIIRALGDEPVDATIIRHKHLRQHCLSCAATPGEVRRCGIIDCPLWPYRMGHNPHHPQRGSNPFARKLREHPEGSRRT